MSDGKSLTSGPCDPPPPGARRQPLRVSAPKAAEDDPGAPERVREIMASATYRRAGEPLVPSSPP